MIVKLLLEAGADVNAKDRDGDTALHNGVYKKHERVVTTLLNHDADINIKNSKGKTPLDIALEIKNTSTDAADIYALLASVNINISPLIEAVRKNNPSLVSKLLKEGADPNQAIKKFEFYFGGYKKILKLPALLYAIRKNYEEVSKLLIDKGANINFEYTTGMTPIFSKYSTMTAAIKNNNIKIMKLLLKKGIDKKIAEAGLIYAAAKGNLSLAKEFVEYGVDVNCRSFRLAMISEANLGSYSDARALSYAVWNKNIPMIKYLIKSGASVDVVPLYGSGVVDYDSILTSEIKSSSRKITKLLIELSPASNLSHSQAHFDGKNLTPLMLAILYAPDIVPLLIKKGVNLNEKNIQGKTALYYAKEKGDTKIIAMLKNAGAR